jgi:hypothetical protein
MNTEIEEPSVEIRITDFTGRMSQRWPKEMAPKTEKVFRRERRMVDVSEGRERECA